MPLLILILILISPVAGQAATWYASATGNSTNGTRSLPWGVNYSATNLLLQSGDTVLFQPGTFVCNETNVTYALGDVLEFKVSGINYRPTTLWGFTFDGGLLLTASNLTVEQFRITYSPHAISRNKSNAFTYPAGITEYGSGNRIMHNLIDGAGHMGIATWKTTNGKYIAGNVIRFCGMNDYFDYPGTARGGGMYAQNADNSAEALIQGNISYYNYTTGMAAKGNTDIWKFTFRNQICAENDQSGIFFQLDDYGSTNFTAISNYLFRNGTGLRIGYPLGNGGHSNAVLAGNYVVDNGYASYTLYQVDGWSNNTWSNNVSVTLLDRYPWLFEVAGEVNGDIASHHIDFNTYYATDAGGFGTAPFFLNEIDHLTLDQWRAAVRGETNSAFIYGVPATNSVFVFRPSTDSAFVHVASFNWTNATTATMDLAGYFRPGERLAVFDAQNIPDSYTNLASFNGTVSLDLTLTNRANMLGSFTQRGTWTGFDPRFRAFVIYAVPVVVAHVANANVGTIVMASQ